MQEKMKDKDRGMRLEKKESLWKQKEEVSLKTENFQSTLGIETGTSVSVSKYANPMQPPLPLLSKILIERFPC